MMIRHCVFVKFKSDISAADKTAIYAKLNALRDLIPGITAASFGANVSPEGKSKGFDDGFTMDFESAEAVDVYIADPNHREAGAALVSMLEGGRDGLMVFDMEINS